MRAGKPVDSISEVVAEIHSLLGNLTWEAQRGAYLRGEKVCILLNPCRGEEADRFDVPIAVLPLVGKASALEGTLIILRRAGEDGAIWHGHLNDRGLVLFRGLEKGIYQTEILFPAVDAVRESWLERWTEVVRSAIAGFLTPLPRLEVAMVPAAATVERHWQRTFHNADGSLVATLWERESGDLELDFEAKDRDWEGAVVGFIWTPIPAEEERPEPQLLFAALAWSDLFKACTAEVSLGWKPQEYELDLPEQPWPLESLTRELAGALQESVVRAATDHTHQAWQRLLEKSEELAPEARRAVEEALKR